MNFVALLKDLLQAVFIILLVGTEVTLSDINERKKNLLSEISFFKVRRRLTNHYILQTNMGLTTKFGKIRKWLNFKNN